MSLEQFYVQADTGEEFGYAAKAAVRGIPLQDGNTSGRVGFTRKDYEDQRLCAAIPTAHHDIMKKMDEVYDTVGLARHLLDLMADFTVQGIEVVHENKSVETFYRNWFNRVQGVDRSERFAANLYKYGTSIVKRRWATLTKKDKKRIRQAAASDLTIDHVKTTARRIPIRYVFLNPATVEVIGGDLARFVGKATYGLRLPYGLTNSITAGVKGEAAIINELMSQIPDEIKEAIKGGGQIIPLRGDISVFHYKKEDWELWAKPIMYGVLQDIQVLEKLKLADLTALDGATNRVRIFKLGSLEHRIAPTEAGVDALNSLLQVNAGGGVRDIIWGPDITMEESSVDSYQFLGEAKYKPTLSAIFAGLGIPPSLTGTSDVGGTTNNLVSLKSFIKKLEYGRAKLIEFWAAEFELVRQVMGFSKAAVLQFGTNNLGDEEAEKKLYIDMADRDIIPFEVVQKKFGLDPTVTSKKVQTEYKERKSKKRVKKADPFHDGGNADNAMKKSLLDKGIVQPSEVGLDMDEKKPGENYKIELMQQQKSGGVPAKQKGQPGRPFNSKDSSPRKRRFKPVVKAMELWASDAQEKIATLVNPVVLAKFEKKNMRSLTDEQTCESEKLKFHILFRHDPLTEVSEASITEAAAKPFPAAQYKKYTEAAKETQQLLGRELTFAELHSIQVGIYANGKN